MCPSRTSSHACRRSRRSPARVADPATRARPPARSSACSTRRPRSRRASQGPIGYQPDALPWMPGGASQPLVSTRTLRRRPLFALRRVRRVAGRAAGARGRGGRDRRAGGAARLERRRRGSRSTAPRRAPRRRRAAGAPTSSRGPRPRPARRSATTGQGFGAVSQIQDWAAAHGPPRARRRAAAAGRPDPLRLRARRHRRVRGARRPADDGRGQPLRPRRARRAEPRRGDRLRPLLSRFERNPQVRGVVGRLSDAP